MKIMGVLPWVISFVSVLVAVVCPYYLVHLDRSSQTSTLEETVRAAQVRIERLDRDLTALRTAAKTDQTRINDVESLTKDSITTSINLSMRLNQTRRDVNDLWASFLGVADADKVTCTFNRMNTRIHDLAQATARDVATLHARIDATQKNARPLQKPDVCVDAFLNQMGREPAAP